MAPRSFPDTAQSASAAASGQPAVSPGRDPSWNNADIELTASLISALAHPLRLSIVAVLADGERSVTELCDLLWSTQPNISHHLAILHSRNVVSFRREAKRALYALTDIRLGDFPAMVPTTSPEGACS